MELRLLAKVEEEITRLNSLWVKERDLLEWLTKNDREYRSSLWDDWTKIKVERKAGWRIIREFANIINVKLKCDNNNFTYAIERIK